ncbi:hypothetical protein ENBRE01_2668, partial [Enteropsectra breve]
MLNGRRNILAAWSIVRLISSSSKAALQEVNPALSGENEIFKAFHTTISFLSGAKSFKAALENNYASHNEGLTRYTVQAINEKSFHNDEYSERLANCYSAMYEKLPNECKKLNMLPIWLPSFLDCENINEYNYRITTKIGLKNPENRQFLDSDSVHYYYIQSTTDKRNLETCSIESLIDETVNSCRYYKMLYNQLQNNLPVGDEIERRIELSKCVIFRVINENNTDRLCEIYKESFNTSQPNATEE